VGTGRGQAALAALGVWLVGASRGQAQEANPEDDAGEAAQLLVPATPPAGRGPPPLGLFGRAGLIAGAPLAVRVDGAPAGRSIARWGDLPAPEAAVVRVEPRAGAGDAEQPGFRPTLLVDTLRADSALTAQAEVRWAPAFLAAAPAANPGGPAAVESALDAPPNPAWRALRASVALGGPLVAEAVALAGAAQVARRGHRPLEPGSAPGADGREEGTLRLTIGRLPGTRVTLGLAFGHDRREPLCRRCDAASASAEDGSEARAALALEQPLGHQTSLLVQASGALGWSDLSAAGPPPGASHTDLSTGWTSGAPGRVSADVPWSALSTRQRRGEVALRLTGGDGALSWKTGAQVALERAVRQGSIPGGVRFLDLGGPCTEGRSEGCLARLEVAPGRDVGASLRLGAFAQVAFRPVPPLTVWLGLRLEAGRLTVPGGPSPWLAGAGPRVTLAWDAAGDGRHLLLLHAGRAHEVGDAALALRAGVQPLQRLGLFDAPGRSFPECATPGARCLFTGGPAGTRWGTLAAPRLDEVGAGYRAALAPGLRAGLDASLAWVDGLWQEQEVNRLRDGAGGLAGSADGTFRSIRQVGSAPSGLQRHQTVDAWLLAHPGRLDARVGYTLAWSSGTASQPFDDQLRDALRPGLASGFLPSDRRHLLQGALEVEAVRGLFLGARLRYATGTPLWQTAAIPSDPGTRVAVTSRGTAVGPGGARVALRNPDAVRLDVEARCDLSAALGLPSPEVELGLLLVNALDSQSPTVLSASPGHVGTVLARQAPRHAELRLRVWY